MGKYTYNDILDIMKEENAKILNNKNIKTPMATAKGTATPIPTTANSVYDGYSHILNTQGNNGVPKASGTAETTSTPTKTEKPSANKSVYANIPSSVTQRTAPTLGNYTGTATNLYESEAQAKAMNDADFARALRYLPTAFKSAGVYGSGQSESMMVDLQNEHLNRQNELTAETNKQVNALKQQYDAEMLAEAEELDATNKVKVDEVANYISGIDWSTRTREDYDNFINYLKSADYTDEQIDLALKQVQAFKPTLNFANLINNATKSANETLYSKNGTYEFRDDNGKNYIISNSTPTGSELSHKLDQIAKPYRDSGKKEYVIFYNNNWYAYNGVKWLRLHTNK